VTRDGGPRPTLIPASGWRTRPNNTHRRRDCLPTRNLVSGKWQSTASYLFWRPGATGNVVEGNYVGTNGRRARAALGNGNTGIVLTKRRATTNRIGTDGDGTNDAGRRATSSRGNRIFGHLYQRGGGSIQNVVAGNKIGNRRDRAASALGNLVDGVPPSTTGAAGTHHRRVPPRPARNVISAQRPSFGVLHRNSPAPPGTWSMATISAPKRGRHRGCGERPGRRRHPARRHGNRVGHARQRRPNPNLRAPNLDSRANGRRRRHHSTTGPTTPTSCPANYVGPPT